MHPISTSKLIIIFINKTWLARSLNLKELQFITISYNSSTATHILLDFGIGSSEIKKLKNKSLLCFRNTNVLATELSTIFLFS